MKVFGGACDASDVTSRVRDDVGNWRYESELACVIPRGIGSLFAGEASTIPPSTGAGDVDIAAVAAAAASRSAGLARCGGTRRCLRPRDRFTVLARLTEAISP